jgi:Arc/MetJ-type ribon-helix-helix transcriptional regulator
MLRAHFKRMQEDIAFSGSHAEVFNGLRLPTEIKNRDNVVLTRLNDEDLALIDVLVETGLYKSRSEAVAYLIHEALIAKRGALKKLMKKLEQIKRLKDEARKILEEK